MTFSARVTGGLGPHIGSYNGLYRVTNGEIKVLVDTNTALPDDSGNFRTVRNSSFDGSNIAFYGVGTTGSNSSGIYMLFDGILIDILNKGDTLDGEEVHNLSISSQSLSGNSLVFTARLDNEFAIYSATINEVPLPAAFWLFGSALLAVSTISFRRP